MKLSDGEWAQEAARGLTEDGPVMEFSDKQCESFIQSAARLALEDPEVARRIGERMVDQDIVKADNEALRAGDSVFRLMAEEAEERQKG